MDIAERALQLKNDIDAVYETGVKARDDIWWNTYFAPMREGKPCNYLFAGPAWNSATFYPNQDIVPLENADGLFNRFNWNSGYPNIDLAQRLQDCGVIIDLSKAVNCTNTFYYAYITRLPSLMVCSSKYVILNSTFANAKYLTTIDELIIKDDGTNVFSSAFDGCTALKNIKITGVIGRSINFSVCPLSAESLKSIISSLMDYGEDPQNAYKYTLTVKSSAFSVLETEETTAEYQGADCTWAELVDNKKWNLALA